MGGRVGPDLGQDGLPRPQAVEVAEAELDAARDQVDVGVLEGGQDQPAAQIDDAGGRAAPGQGLPDGADENDPAAGHGQGFGPGDRPGHRDDRGVRQDEVGRRGGRAAAAPGHEAGQDQEEGQGSRAELDHANGSFRAGVTLRPARAAGRWRRRPAARRPWPG
jgi:hypothetical protein